MFHPSCSECSTLRTKNKESVCNTANANQQAIAPEASFTGINLPYKIKDDMHELTPYYKPQDLKWFNVIGWYQVIGGIIGGGVLLWLLIQNSSFISSAMIVIGIGLNSYSIFAGNQLLKNRYFKPTYIIQAAQILNFVGLGITFQIVIGLAVGIGFEWLDDAEFVFNFKLLSLYDFNYKPSQTDAIRVVVNFVPIFIIDYLIKRKGAAEDRKRLVKYSSADD